MKEMVAKVQALAGEEFASACLQYGMFNSPHEGASILREEIEEAVEGVSPMVDGYEHLWKHVRGQATVIPPLEILSKIEETAIHTASELIQVAAMCQKNRLLYAQEEIPKED